MKKIITSTLSVFFLVSLTACSSSSTNSTTISTAITESSIISAPSTEETSIPISISSVLEDSDSSALSSESTIEPVETSVIAFEDSNDDINISAIFYEMVAGEVGEGESIAAIEYDTSGKILIIHVDFSEVEPPTPLTLEDLVRSRASRITDEILDYEEYDSYWDVIRIDFGDLGYIEGDKTMITKNEYDLRYFEFPVDDNLEAIIKYDLNS